MSTTSGSNAAMNGTLEAYRHCLTTSIGALLIEHGYDSAEPLALQTLTEMMQAFIHELGRSMQAFTELASRQSPLPADVLLALVEMGYAPVHLKEYAMRIGKRALPAPGVAQVPRQTSILHTGDRKRHKPNGIIPENFVEFPDSHSYIRTPTHKQPVTDYESVREKAASQKRDVERALTRFIAKIGKTHSLFNTDDTNLFPLIACDRTMPDQPILPPYINALLFKDQIFEEDEREFLPKPKKKKKEADQSKEGEKEDDGGGGGGGGGDDDKDESDVKKRDSSDRDEQANETVVENPFIKPPRLPRSMKKLAL